MTTVSNDLLNTMNGTKTSKKSDVQEATDRFMTLLVTQIKNQDPTNPMDNSQMTSQLAQLSTVSGINQLNDTVSSLMTNIQASQSLQASAIIGKTVSVQSDILNKTTLGSSSPFKVDFPSKADSVSIDVVNQAGNVVRTLDVGTQSSGIKDFSWDGLDANGSPALVGNYKLVVNAKLGGAKVTTKSYIESKVEQINQDPTTGVTAKLENGLSVSFAGIKSIS